jgi:UDP-N-acetylenolpyruvoylglucosamine reductase
MNMSESGQFIKAVLRGKLSLNEPMRRHTSWRAGGVAERFYQPADLDDLRVFLCCLPYAEPLFAVGLGSNLLVRDGGIVGTVLLLHGALKELSLQADGLIYAQAGVPGAKLARFAALHGCLGAEFFAGIPGTLGGMLAMNAGCYGGETWQHVVKVQVLTRSGELLTRTPGEYEIGYRSVTRIQDEGCRMQDAEASAGFTESRILNSEYSEIFVGAWLSFEQGDGDIARQKIKALLSKRIVSQPLNFPNAGSVFRNPPGDHAARLIELCGLKGRKIGGAQVSDKHANFIVNVGGATADDIESLISLVRETVASQTGVLLHPEVKIIGDVQVKMNKKETNDGGATSCLPKVLLAKLPCCLAVVPQSVKSRSKAARPYWQPCSAAAWTRTPLTLQREIYRRWWMRGLIVPSSHCTDALAKTVRCRARWNCWEFLTPAVA